MKTKGGSLVAIIPFFLVACNTPRYMYNPSAQNVPVLVKKGDSKLSGSYATDRPPFNRDSQEGISDKNNGFDVQGAVAITGNFAIQANYFNRTERNTGGDVYAITGNTYIDSAVIRYKRNLLEIGVGYFKSLNTRDRVFFQLFGGVGMGRFSFTDNGRMHTDTSYTSYTRNHSSDITKFYIQPAMIFRPRSNFAITVSTRVSVIKYSNIKTDYDSKELLNYELNNLTHGSYAFWEPAFTNSFGFKKLPGIRFEYQFGFSFILNDDWPLNYHPFSFSAGITLDLPKLLAGKAGNDKN